MLRDESLEGRDRAQEVKLGKDGLAWMLPSRRKMDLLWLSADLRPAPASTGVAVSPRVSHSRKASSVPQVQPCPGLGQKLLVPKDSVPSCLLFGFRVCEMGLLTQHHP